MHHAVQRYWPQLFPICLRPDHNGQSQAEVCQIMTDKQRDKEHEAIHFSSFNISGIVIANVSACKMLVSSYFGRKDSDIFLLSQEKGGKDADK